MAFLLKRLICHFVGNKSRLMFISFDIVMSKKALRTQINFFCLELTSGKNSLKYNLSDA